MKMNHDYAHCADYKYGRCPKKCFRAQLVEDLPENPAFDVSWQFMKGTEECPLTNKEIITKNS